MSERAPRSYEMEVELPGLATDAEDTYVAGRAQEDGELTAATLIPTANVTGANTNNRQYDVINKGQDGNGAVVMATLALVSGVNPTDYNEQAFTLSVVAGAVEVAEGDIIAVASTAPGTGIADPGGMVKLTFGRS